MDDTQTSRVSDAAAATRKRRSSILKSQRPPRTPFSELEFNVATPTDNAKSRRVSFSRRTGVAEFATNEATTTWKNFYEEHNRSLESSGNECASKQIGHIGKRIFDQQFEVVEDDFVGIHDPGHMNKSLSLNTFNHQLLSLDRTEELKMRGNHSIMQLSTFTNTNTNLFGEPAMPRGEVTDRIDINFSNVQTIGNDDLDDIEHDLKQNFQGAFERQNMSEYIQVDLDMTQAALCNDDMSITDTVHSPEVHVPINIENSNGNLKLGQSDDLDEMQRDLNKKYGREISMSQSINSLKVLDPKTKLIDSNCEVDKENIVLNPYAPLRETENFAVNKEVDKVLVFDGKRLTLQADKVQDEPLLPKPIENAQRKTIVLNFNDDLPNFVEVPITHTTGMIEVTQLKKNLVLKNMSITEPLLDTNKRSFILDEDQGNITITQVVATNIVSDDKRRTIHYDDSEGNISLTQALPTKIAEKRRTIVYDDEEGDMSITRAFPTNFLGANVQNEKRKTIVFNDGNMSMTQAIPSNIIPEKTIKRSIFVEDTQEISNITSNEAQKQKTEKSAVFFEDDYCNFSVAQAIPSFNSIGSKQPDRERTVVFEADTGNISVTQVVPSVIIHEKVNKANIEAVENKVESQNEKVKRRTIMYDNDTGDLSITQSIPNYIFKTNLFPQKNPTEDRINDVTNIANSDTKRKTIVFDNDDADISMTQAVSVNQVLCTMRDENKEQTTKSEGASYEVTNTANSDTDKRKTIVFDNDDADISMTQAVSVNRVLCAMRDENKEQTTKSEGASYEVTNTANSNTDKRKTIVFDNDDADISMTQAVSVNRVLCAMRDENKEQTTKSEGASYEVTNTANSNTDKRKTIVFDNDDADISMTQAVSVNQVLCAMRDNNNDQTTKSEGASNDVTNTANSYTNKRKTILFDNDNADISMTQAVSVYQVLCAMGDENKEQTTKSKGASNDVTNTASSYTNKRKTILFDNNNADISMTQAVSVYQVLCAMGDENKEQTKKSEGASNEVTNTANSDTNKRKTIVFDNDNADISITQTVSENQVLFAMRDENKDQTTKSKGARSEVTNTPSSDTNQRKTIVFHNDNADISITQAVSVNQVLCAMRDENKEQTTESKGASSEVTNTPNSDTNKRKTIVFHNDDADISMTQAVSVNQVLCAMRDENIDQTTKSIGASDDANISMTRTVSVNQVLCALSDENEDQTTNTLKENYPEPDVKKSFVHDDFYADISKTVPTNIIKCFNLSINDITVNETVSIETIVQKPNVRHGQDERNVHEDFFLEALHEVLPNKKGKGHRTIVYEKEHENLSVSVNQQFEMEHAPSKSMKANIQEQRNTVFGDVSSAEDSLPEMLARIQNNDENKQSNYQETSETLNIPMMDTINPGNNENVDTEKRFDMSCRNEIKKVIRKVLTPEVRSMNSRTNLQSLTKIENDLEESIRNEMTNVIKENYNEAEVFQTALSLLTDKGDTESVNLEATFHENLSSTSKVDNDNELKQTEEVSSEMHSNEINNMRPQYENKSPWKIPNDNTSVNQDSEKINARSNLFLNDLLDMSSSVDETRLAGQPGEDTKKLAETDSDCGMFVITQDQKETKSQTDATDDTPQLIVQSPLPLEYKDKRNNELLPLSQKIQNKLHNIKEVLVKSKNKTVDKILTPILKGKSKEDGAKSAPVTIRGHLALENICEAEPEEKQGFVSRRQSIAISREDLLNNLSMAAQALNTPIYFDEDNQTEDSPESENSPINNVRISNEVVKTLHFDESSTETNLFQKLTSPLQKSAIGVTSYVNDYKSNVIPQFTTVSDGIKELMDDLVKPNSDILPFDSSLSEKATNKVSTHSTQVQANLVTSSQVELPGYASESICNRNMNTISSADTISDAVSRSFTRSFKTPIKSFTTEAFDKISETEIVKQSVRFANPVKGIESPSRVLVFDHFNPLNNILLSPKMCEAHTYDPVQSDDGTVSESNSTQMSLYDKNVESSEKVTMQYNVSSVRNCMKQSGDSTFNRSKCLANPDLCSRLSLENKPPSFDRSTEVITEKDLKSAKVNTLIAMKENFELLENHSSLTLVDDTLAQSSFDVTMSPGQASAMKVLYSSYTKEDVLCDIDSEIASNEVLRKSKKRGRDKQKQTTNIQTVNCCINKQVELTPKPNKKIPKLSESPYTMRSMQSQDVSQNVFVISEKCNNVADNALMPILVTENKAEPISPESNQDKVIVAIHKSKSVVSSLDPSQTGSQSCSDMDADSSEMQSSCTSSKNLRGDVTPAESDSSKLSKMELQPDDVFNEMRENVFGVSVVAMIEKLPYIGRECEWESRSNDMWSFRMLHRRIRLMMRLEQTYNSGRCVSHDTVVKNISVEIVQHDSKNILAAVCVRFAAETMQWFVNRGCSTARGLPTLVRQCAAAARLAARWGRFMSEARHHLAYSLTPQGLVTLKVANIPLRCVWEVTLQLRLINGPVAPFVEASDVTVTRVMSCTPIRTNDDPERLLRDLPKDWSHAPRAIWKIFKSLKRMTRKEDDELFMAH